ncbi:DEAD/DEAH box helicase [Aquipuribacter nitratireducens]|uniref:DEAD/DEAH box helicase n=1 Tax=Aquipuribacter nitratireducens TaxID=650104 RepID=A0ABW0GKQ2_9MICO
MSSSADLSPAERFAAARRRRKAESSPLGRFVAGLGFDPDPFQVEAMEAVAAGHGVLVAAPTGAGKTVVGELAVHLALETGRKAFYTTPIKALSNQKYADLVAVHGADAVGLLTGDVSVNGEAPVVVMTTEVLRNMIYAGSRTLDGLGFVVMDEVHYLADRFRGAVWEEVIIHLAEDVQVVSLSATVSNAEEFGEWLATVRGDTRVVVSEHRPVPLWQHVMVGDRLHDLFVDPEGDPVLGLPGEDRHLVNPELVALAREDTRFQRRHRGRPPRGGARPRRRPSASRAQVVEALDADGLLPAIHFIFSRNGCDAAVRQCLAWGVRLTTSEERREIRLLAEERTAALPDADLGVLGWSEWVEGLERGIAAHHAGLLPVFKETVEELFRRGLVKVVFATETLALGVNMPARSVVLEKLVKWNGEQHVDVTPGEYTQLTGRAGRRGIDVEGHAVVLWHEGLDPDHVAGLASTRTYPLRSSFAPTYSMAVNLVEQVGREEARRVLETSFAQFQADRAVVGLATQLRKQEEALEGYTEAMTCHLGDFEAYHRLRRRVSALEKDLSRRASAVRRADAEATLERLRRGDVIAVPSGRERGWAVVLDPGLSAQGPRPTVLTEQRQVRRLDAVQFPSAVRVVTTVRVPKGFEPGDPRARRDLASSLRNALAQVGGGTTRPPRESTAPEADQPGELELVRLRRELRAHPCHGCADREDHARWAQRRDELEQRHAELRRRVEGRTAVIARTFDRVCDVLTELGYLDGDTVTPAGRALQRIYTQSDLLVAECLRTGVWDGLDGPSLAAVVSTLAFEARRETEGVDPRLPGRGTAAAWTATVRLWSEVTDVERRHRLPPLREPDAGFAAAVHRWAQGRPLETVLRENDLSPGDFVRWCRQTVDLLDQVHQAAPRDSSLRAAAAQALAGVRRGVVEYSLSG